MEGLNRYTRESETERCPECGKPILYGHIEVMGNTYESRLECPCVTARKERERAELLAAERLVARDYRGMAAGLSKRGRSQRFRNYAPEEGQKEAFEAARAFAKAFIEDKHDGTGLLLIGGVGSGKSHLAAAVVNAVLDYIPIPDSEADNAFRLGYPEGARLYSVRFVPTVGLLEEIRASYDNRENAQEIMQQYKAAKLLVLDDMGAERPTEWVRERLFDIIDYRYNECLPTIITSNANIPELRQHLGDRLCDRIRSMCKTITVKAGSRRPTGDNRQPLPDLGPDFDTPPEVDTAPPFEGDMPIPIYEGDTMADVLQRGEEILQRERDREKALVARMTE